MDFSGQKSRVIENPSEALSVAVEEGLSWRVSQVSLNKNKQTIMLYDSDIPVISTIVNMCFDTLVVLK